jgi:hypothetical protein
MFFPCQPSSYGPAGTPAPHLKPTVGTSGLKPGVSPMPLGGIEWPGPAGADPGSNSVGACLTLRRRPTKFSERSVGFDFGGDGAAAAAKCQRCDGTDRHDHGTEPQRRDEPVDER